MSEQAIGKIIKQLRQSKRLNKSQLSTYSDVSHSAISLIEAGKRRPLPETLKKLSAKLDVDYEFLLRKAGYIPDDDLVAESTSIYSVDNTPINEDEADVAKQAIRQYRKLAEKIKKKKD